MQQTLKMLALGICANALAAAGKANLAMLRKEIKSVLDILRR